MCETASSPPVAIAQNAARCLCNQRTPRRRSAESLFASPKSSHSAPQLSSVTDCSSHRPSAAESPNEITPEKFSTGRSNCFKISIDNRLTVVVRSKTRKRCGNFPHPSIPPRSPADQLFSLHQEQVTSMFSYSCALFCSSQNTIPLVFNRFRTLSSNHPGWVV